MAKIKVTWLANESPAVDPLAEYDFPFKKGQPVEMEDNSDVGLAVDGNDAFKVERL